MSTLPPQELAGLWEPERPYLNTASYGLPPQPAWDALQVALEEWRGGRTSWESWTTAVARARASFARLVGTGPEHVATGASVSELAGIVAASLPPGSRVLAGDIEYASILWPFLARADVETRTVPLDRLVDEVDDETTLVAISAVQSSDGRVADLAALREAAPLLLVDATQACGWLPLTEHGADFLICHSYKWLCSPRGAAFIAVRPERLDALPPLHASWWAAQDPYGMYYGPPLRLDDTARRLDTSPAWFSWVGAAAALEVIEGVGVERIHAHDVALANRFRAGVGLEPGDSAIVAVDAPAELLEQAGIRAAVRAGGLRVSFHLYNTEADVDAALDALGTAKPQPV